MTKRWCVRLYFHETVGSNDITATLFIKTFILFLGTATSRTQPPEVSLEPISDSRVLRIHWHDGIADDFPAVYLRDNCQCPSMCPILCGLLKTLDHCDGSPYLIGKIANNFVSLQNVIAFSWHLDTPNWKMESLGKTPIHPRCLELDKVFFVTQPFSVSIITCSRATIKLKRCRCHLH